MVRSSADGCALLTAGQDGSVMQWYIEWELVPWDSQDAPLECLLRSFMRRHRTALARADRLRLQDELRWSGLWCDPHTPEERLAAVR